MTTSVKNNVFADIDEAPQSGAELVQTHETGLKTTQRFDLTDSELELADFMGVSLEGNAVSLVRNATQKTNPALNLVIESGLMLIAATNLLCERSQSKTGSGGHNEKPDFKAAIESAGLPLRRAYEAMSMAKYAANLPADERDEMLALPKTKVMLLAQADPEVVADLFGDEDVDIKALSVRELKQQIRQLKADKAQSTVELRKAEAQVEKLENQIDQIQHAHAPLIGGVIPPHVSDLRLELAALTKQAELSIDSMGRTLDEIHLLDGEWSLSSARFLFAALQSLHTQSAGILAQLHREYGAALNGETHTLVRLTQEEIFKCAVSFSELIAQHEHAAALREHERDAEKPKGRGRPKAAPKAN